MTGLPPLDRLTAAVTGRRESLFAPVMERHGAELEDRVRGRRVAVIGAAGSIGAAVARCLSRYALRELVLFDLSENLLVELVRDLRSSPAPPRTDVTSLPVGMGSVEFGRYFAETPPFDYVFNLAAMKHVRSEKDVYCLIRMVDTNVLFVDELLRSLPYRLEKFFSVSSDKAVNPANLMGASKMVMEKVHWLRSAQQPFSTARFANVAFSQGSLLDGFLHRLEKRQPLAAPSDVRRYFISGREAGELSLLSGLLGRNGDVFFSALTAGEHERTFADVARDLLERLGYEPVECDSEAEARERAAELIGAKRWPCFFAPSDTSGEKAFEEFFGPDDRVDFERFPKIGVVNHGDLAFDPDAVEAFLDFARRARTGPVAKSDYVRAFSSVIPSLRHQELHRNLDEKM